MDSMLLLQVTLVNHLREGKSEGGLSWVGWGVGFRVGLGLWWTPSS